MPPTYGATTSIVGVYAISGTEPGGKPEPPGKATITRVGSGQPEVYRLVEEVGGTSVEAICLRRGSLVGCGWSSGRPLGVALYDPTSEGFVGAVLVEGTAAPARERLLADPATPGQLRIDGVRPGGDAYAGTFTVSEGPAGVIRALRAVPGEIQLGFGLRDGGSLVFGLNHEGSCGVVEYRVEGAGVLEGHWIDPLRASQVGTERLTRL